MDAELYCEVAGAGRTVVLTHDGLVHHEGYDEVFADLARDHRVARWDRRGYGRSGPASSAYSSSDDLADVIRSVTDGPAVLVGSSFGSLVTLVCALDHPELARALVLVGPVVTGHDLSEHFLTRGGRNPPATAAEAVDYWSRVDPWFVAPANGAARERLRTLLQANPQNLEPPIHEGVLSREPAAGRLSQIAVPTLVVVGADDIADVHAHSGVVEAGIAGARRVVLPGSGHSVPMEVPGPFIATVRAFLAGLP